jgi:hypothetical protein
VSPPTKALLKIAAAVALTVVALAMVGQRVNRLRKTGEEGAAVWFYDLSEKRLYMVPRETVPPDAGIGGPKGDGVRAVVVAFRGEQGDPGKRRIAYLETCTPALKGLRERVRQARATGKAIAGGIPPRDSDYVQTNSLVKEPDEAEWHSSGSAEGRRIMTEWRSWRAPDGQPPVVCTP